MHHPLYKVKLYQHEQKECQKKKNLCRVMLLVVISPASELKL